MSTVTLPNVEDKVTEQTLPITVTPKAAAEVLRIITEQQQSEGAPAKRVATAHFAFIPATPQELGPSRCSAAGFIPLGNSKILRICILAIL